MLRPTRTLLAAASLSLAWIAGALATDGPIPADAPQAEPVAIDLSVLRDRPLRHLGTRVRTVIQLSSYDEPWQAQIGRFGPSHFARISAWSDTQFPWVTADYLSPAPFLFTRRDSTADFVLRNARAHERFAVTLDVCEQFGGEPWCEIVELERIEPSINEGCVLHASRAIESRDKGAVELAYSELERALASPMPAPAHGALEALRAKWQAADGR
ncbi:hypothetical protein [Engelhardtia mirabilis]|uniref:Uncharacterized protein n=1 Tax=Engelhardtia mirabilis TaxID=2528011 RepID=A0A518BFJ1_9BACT|nr:hypothetical protein Pla133_07480 [Planctomycetes bacterium Pla133]QDV00009.1 hypothetical protein Pla86_07470 [Planctomycetes bacterium Pla86]